MKKERVQESLESLLLEAMKISRDLGFKEGYRQGRSDLENEIQMLNKFSTIKGFVKYMLGK